MLVNEIKLFELLKAKIGEKEAEAFVELIEIKANGKVDFRALEIEKNFKSDIASLKEHIDGKFANMDVKFANMESKFDAKLANMEATFDKRFIVIDTRLENNDKMFATKADLADTKAELLKWMFIFWAGQIGALIAILTIFFKH